MIGEKLTQDAEVLELGPGPGNRTCEFLATRVKSLHGLDIDQEALSNPFLSSCFIYDGGKFPLSSQQYDAVIADYVLEHLESPKEIFKEVSRVLKPGGFFIFRTPNLWHYVSIIARLTPHSFHIQVANKARGRKESAHDPYPTYFRANSKRQLKLLLESSNMTLNDCRMVEKEPSYLQFSRVAFLLGVAYERIVNFFPFLSGIRANIFAVVKKHEL